MTALREKVARAILARWSSDEDEPGDWDIRTADIVLALVFDHLAARRHALARALFFASCPNGSQEGLDLDWTACVRDVDAVLAAARKEALGDG